MMLPEKETCLIDNRIAETTNANPYPALSSMMNGAFEIALKNNINIFPNLSDQG